MRHKLFLPFSLSLILGIIIWILIFAVLPVNVTKSLSLETIGYIVLSYTMLFIGYFITPNLKFQLFKLNISSFYLYMLLLIIALGFVFRYIDLIGIRGLSFSNNIYENRKLAAGGMHSFWLFISSLPKHLFFVPLLLYYEYKHNNKLLLIASILLFLLPLPEAILRGSRSPFIMSLVLLLFILFYYRKIKVNVKTLALSIFSFLLLIGVSIKVLEKREHTERKEDYKKLLTEARYNDFLKPNNRVLQWFETTDNLLFIKVSVNLLQIGQYYTHGVFEMNYLISEKLTEKQYGKYTFIVVPKFLNRLGLTKYDINAISESNPRTYTFVGAFGGFFIDFAWFALIVFFFIGVFQNILYQLVKKGYFFFLPLFMYLLYANFFLLTYNFYTGNGSIILIVCIIFAAINIVANKYENSTYS